MKRPLTQARLREALDYAPATGALSWKIQQCWRVEIGQAAGSLRQDGYISVVLDCSRHMAHRLAWLYVHGAWPVGQIDHINGDRADNRIANLRDVDQAANSQNRVIASTNNDSGLLGVSRKREKWRARIRVGSVQRQIGTFETAEAAHAAYLEAKLRLHPAWGPSRVIVAAAGAGMLTDGDTA